MRQLRTFLAVVEHRTVTDAATALDLAPSSVSQQIRVLEADLGVALFVRRHGGMDLTEAGERLSSRAPRLLDEVERARREVAGLPRTLRFGAMETMIATRLPSLLRRLGETRPDLDVRVDRADNHTDLMERVRGGELDAGLTLDSRVAALPPELAYVDLEPVVPTLAVRGDHPLAGRGPVTRAELRGHRMILGPKACSFHVLTERYLAPHDDLARVSSVFVARSWAAQGIGAVLLPDFTLAAELDAGTLVRVPLAEELQECWMRLVWRADRETEPDLRDLLYSASIPEIIR
ncbi:LysR family transcriptional regulator [Nonomuraea sp. NPDC050310]|uniref:LysR family transcriptional regulator n=1 Tax=unclassified Nonomuraea TaxID=2593643 RepID=UPI0033DD6B6B